jgi:hypothetical protein
MRLKAFVAPLALFALGCQAHPPPRWAEGGAPIDIPRARWTREGQLIDIMPDGKILRDGEHLFTVDRAGRVYEPDNEPVAVLQPDGRLVGRDDAGLGRIGLRNAALPGQPTAWLALGDKFEVLHFNAAGDAKADGAWTGCGTALRTCALVSHLVSYGEMPRYPGYMSPHVSVGVGMGVMFAP